MTRRQSWADRALAGDASRRGEQRKLLVELELDDAVFVPGGRAYGRPDQRGGYFPATIDHPSGGYQANQRAYRPGSQPSEGNRRSRTAGIDDGGVGGRPYSPRGIASPGLEQASRLSSPYKLKQKVLSSRRGSVDSVDAGDGYGDDDAYHSRRTGRRSSNRSGGIHSGERTRQARRSGAGSDSRASPTALVRDAIRQNIRMRDQVLEQLRGELVPPAIAVQRARTSEMNVSSSLIKELNRLRTLTLAVVEMVVYLYTQRTADERNGGSVERRRHSGKADDDEEDEEALEREFFPYLLRMAAADTDFLSFSPALQRLFDAQSVSLSRNPLVEGLSLDASELLLCSCNYVSASSPSALFSSSRVLTSSSSLFQLLIHKLEAFALQTERYLPGWQVLPCDRVATALLHLMELETRSNAARLLPTYLRPSLSRGNSAAMGSRSTSSILPQDSPSTCGLAQTMGVSRAESNAEFCHRESAMLSTPQRTPASIAHQAWDMSTPDSNPILPPVVAPTSSVPSEVESGGAMGSSKTSVNHVPAVPQAGIAEAASIVPASSYSGGSVRVMPEAKQPADSNTSARLFEKSGGSQKPDSFKVSLPVTQQQADSALIASGKGDIGIPEQAAGASPSQHQIQVSTVSKIIHPKPGPVRTPLDEATPVAKTNKADPVTTTDVVQGAPITPKAMQAIASVRESTRTGDGAEIDPTTEPAVGTRRDETLPVGAREGHAPSLVPRLSLHMIPASTHEIDDIRLQSATVNSGQPAHTTTAKTLPGSSSRESCVNTAKPSGHASAGSCDVEISLCAPSVVTEAAPTSTRPGSDRELHSDVDTSPSLDAISNCGSSLRPCSPTASIGSSRNARNQTVSPRFSNNSATMPDHLSTVISSDRSQQADKGVREEPPSPSSVVSDIAKALDLLPKFDSGGAQLSSGDQEDHGFGSGSSASSGTSALSSYRSTNGDDESIAVKRKNELWPLPSASARGNAMSQLPVNTRSELVRITRPDSLNGYVDRAAAFRDTSNTVGMGALDRIFDLCRDVQVAAFDLSHRFSEIEVGQNYHPVATALPMFQPAYLLSIKPVGEANETPRYLERELKVLRRYFVSWRENAHHQSTVKRRLQRAAAQWTVQRFGTQCVVKRRLDQESRHQEQRHLAARAMQKSWAGYAYRKTVEHRSCDFHLVHKCFHRLRFYVGISKRKRQREQAKETILRWWRCRQAQFGRVKWRQEELRKQRQRREQATRIVKQVLREWILRRRLARAQVAARQVLFKENLKWTKAKRDHERTLRIEHKRQTQWTSMMKASMAELESKWKQAEEERVTLQGHYKKMVERHQRTIDKKRREVAAHKIQWFMASCALKRKLQAAEATRSRTDQQLKMLNAQTQQADQETHKWRQKMRLEQRLLEKRLAKAKKQMVRASTAHEREMQAQLSNERQLQQEIARRTIKSFIDRRCLERRARVDNQRQVQLQRQLRAEKQETEAMAAEDLQEHHRGARLKRALLEDRLSEVHREAQQLLASRDRLLKTKDEEVQRAIEQLQQNQVDASRARLNVWLTQQVRVSRVKKQADASLAAAAQAMEAEKRRQVELVASQSREVALLKIGAFLTNQVNRYHAKRQEAATQWRQAELYAMELVTEQRLRSFVVEMIIAVKLQSESEASAGLTKALQGIREVSAFLAKRRVRLHQLRRIVRARSIQRCWRRWSVQQQLIREERERKLQRVDAVKRRECARHIQNEWRLHRQRKATCEAEREERERKLQRVRAVQRRECARHIQRAWRLSIVRKKQKQVELGRRLRRLEVVQRRECARHIQAAWRLHTARKRCQIQERERKRLRVEAAKRRECARRIQHAWLASVKRKGQAREDRERKLRAVKLAQRRACARRIQSAWRQHVQRRRTRRDTIKRLKERVRATRRRESARKIQTAWRKARLRRYQQKQEQQALEQEKQAHHERERKTQRVRATKQRECARKIQIAWRTARLRQYQLQLEHEELGRRLQRVAAIKERECARHIQNGWRRHSGQRRRGEREETDRKILRVDAVRRRECERHIQSGWHHSREHQREPEQAEDKFRQLMDRRLGELRSRQCARVVQRSWREWYELKKSARAREQCLSLIRARRAARCIQSHWRYWRRAHETAAERNKRLRSIRESRCARVIHRRWRQWHRDQERLRFIGQQIASIRRRCAARIIQRAWRGWQQTIKQRAEQASKQSIAEDASARQIQRQFLYWMSQRRCKHEHQALIAKQEASAARIQRVYRRWKRSRVSNELQPTYDEAMAQEEVVALKKRVCGRRIIRAWRRFCNVNQFAAATHIGAVWRGRCARQAYALALEAKRAQDERLEEIRLSILAVRVQRCYQDWRVRMRRRKRLEILAREHEMIAQANLQTKLQSVHRRVSAAQNIQTRFRAFSCQESECKLKSLEQTKADEEREEKDASAILQREDHDRDEAIARVNVGAVVEHWMSRDLPYILTTGVSAVHVVDTAARVIQRFFRRYRRRALLWFHTKRSLLPNASGSGSDDTSDADDEFRFYFQHASAWMEWRKPQQAVMEMTSRSTLRLRFEAQMTRKLLAMLDRQAHSVDEIRHAISEIATDALPIFASDECRRSHETNADRKTPYHNVGELELPHFCVLTRSMGKIRSMHRRQQHSASFTATGELTSKSPPVTPKSGYTRPRCSRVQSLLVFEAVENASVDDAVYIQSLGADLGAVEPKMLRNALHLLTFSTENYRFRLEMLDFLLQDGKAEIDAMDINGETPSMLFAAHGHLEFLARMVKRGADLQLTNKNGQNVLHRACEEDQVEIVTYLHRSILSASALDLHVPDQLGRYPLHIVASKGLTECAKQLLSFDEISSSSVEPSSTRWDHVLQSHRDSQGRTPLHLAVLARDTAMVSLLLTHEGDFVINECDEMRRSAAHFAVDASSSSNAGSTTSSATDMLTILTMLIEYGANLNIGDERGDTPLHWAAFAGNVALVHFLVTRGADTAAVNSDWETPGQVAAAFGHFSCVKAMASLGHHRGHGRDSAVADAESGGSATEYMLHEAVNNLAYQQASSQSYHIPSTVLPGGSPASTRAAASGESYYWEELHQEVQLVDESGRFSSEDESDDDDDDSANAFGL